MSLTHLNKHSESTRDDREVRRLLPENDYVTIYTLKSFLFFKVGMFRSRCIHIR